jgi:hypothetical protein
MYFCWNETSWYIFLFIFDNFSKIILESVGPKTEDLYKKLPCLVCGASASGIHFGAVTCEACKVRIDIKRENFFIEINLSRVFFVDQ